MTSKRPRLEPHAEAARAIGRIKIDFCAQSQTELKKLAHKFTKHIVAGPGMTAIFSTSESQEMSETASGGTSSSSSSSSEEEEEEEKEDEENEDEDKDEEDDEDEDDVERAGGRSVKLEDEGVEQENTDVVSLDNGHIVHVRQYYGSDFAQRIVSSCALKCFD
jgi:ketosteroid isomerase-like protein